MNPIQIRIRARLVKTIRQHTPCKIKIFFNIFIDNVQYGHRGDISLQEKKVVRADFLASGHSVPGTASSKVKKFVRV